MIVTILIIIGVLMGLSFLALVFVILVDHFSHVEGYENPKDPLKISSKVLGIIFVTLLISFFVINLLGYIGLIH